MFTGGAGNSTTQRRRQGGTTFGGTEQPSNNLGSNSSFPEYTRRAVNWKRILLLIVAITIHNIPGTNHFVLSQTIWFLIKSSIKCLRSTLPRSFLME